MKTVIFLLSCFSLLAADFFDSVRKGDLPGIKAELDKGFDVNAKWRYDQTALFIAAGRGHVDIIKLLLDRGATMNIKDSFYGMTPLSYAGFNNHPNVVKLLLDKGAEGREQMLIGSAGGGKKEIVAVILDSGAFKPEVLTNAYMAAKLAGHAEVAEMLKKAGAVVSDKAETK